jgi:hypothetical protein
MRGRREGPRPALRANLEPAYADPSVLTDALVTRHHDLMLAPGGRDAMLARVGSRPVRPGRPRGAVS